MLQTAAWIRLDYGTKPLSATNSVLIFLINKWQIRVKQSHGSQSHIFGEKVGCKKYSFISFLMELKSMIAYMQYHVRNSVYSWMLGLGRMSFVRIWYFSRKSLEDNKLFYVNYSYLISNVLSTTDFHFPKTWAKLLRGQTTFDLTVCNRMWSTWTRCSECIYFLLNIRDLFITWSSRKIFLFCWKTQFRLGFYVF